MGIELSFANSSLRDLCENFAKAKKALGMEAAENLFSRFLDFKAAASLSDFPFEIYDESNEKFFLINSKYKVFFSHNHVSPPQKNQTDIDWDNVKRIKILRIEKSNHD